jgi:hypothetical protein
MRCLVYLLFSLTLAGIARADAGPRDLFNGRDLAGWEFVGEPAADITALCKVRAEGVMAFAGRPVGFIVTQAIHSNYRLHAEWRWPGKPGNGGVLLHIGPGPKASAWPRCFQVQIKHRAAGDLLPMAGTTFAEPLTSAPGADPSNKAHSGADSEKTAGEWNTCDITCRGGAIEVVINGVLQNSVTGCSLQAGKIGFQFEGTPFELRHVSVVSLD